jgi:hypothetical protein
MIRSFRIVPAVLLAAGVAAPAAAQQRTTVVRETVTTVTIPAADYERWQKAGHSTQDIFFAYNAAAAANRPVDEVFTMRRNGRSWDQISRDLNVPMYRIYAAPHSGASVVAGSRMETPPPAGVAGTRMMYGAHEVQQPGAFFAEGYRLTPAEYRRLRAQGFTRAEVFMIANASRRSGLPPEVFANAIYRGLYARGIANTYGIDPFELTRVLPEWKTEAWARAVGEDVYTQDKLDVWW